MKRVLYRDGSRADEEREQIMDVALTVYDWIGRILVIPAVVALALGIYQWARGVLPALYRLGSGLALKEIALLAKGDNAKSIRSLLLDSRLFSPQNLKDITSPNDLGSAEHASVLLVYWEDWKDHIDEVLSFKKDRMALVIYAPPQAISREMLERLDSVRHTIVANFRGRLLNDVLLCLVTAGD
ncbi:MAG: hypothetical protein IRZ31_03310 [Thermogemmatispora sp.]|uniref:hypothetical protein n=1 Tax=Thermogemmatispora sp. TaxID=1968838 RepID=UPI00260F839A|nr:hypothetical protein [Thermogemmatispora sp.]MBX5455906.1 hypothetical protein [Thermogemmatispora sp.]